MDPWLESFAHANFRRSADTAHDLKTPLNVAVLNLELLRMRMQKLLDGTQDAKLDGYTRAIDVELRRMGQIFDAFFLLSTPPRDGAAPAPVDVVPLAREAAEAAGIELPAGGTGSVIAHQARIRQAVKLFFDGAARACTAAVAAIERDGSFVRLTVTGAPASDSVDPAKLFKFYYTDAAGNPDLSLATARIIAETYGGDVSAAQENGRVELTLQLPLGER